MGKQQSRCAESFSGSKVKTGFYGAHTKLFLTLFQVEWRGVVPSFLFFFGAVSRFLAIRWLSYPVLN